MRYLISKLNEWDSSIGPTASWIFRLIVIGAICYAVLFADNRYLKRQEVEEYMASFHKMRSEDMAQIYASIDRVRTEGQKSDDIVRKLEGRLGRIEAQNEIILNRIENLTNVQ